MSNDYVRLETGQMVKKRLLTKSGLYSSMLASYGGDQGLTLDNERMMTGEALQLPVPSSISDEVIDDYVNFIDKDKDVPHIKACLKACSLIDDPDYLEFCVKRFLSKYSKCKDVLNEINGPHLEDICLLMPKDLWPEYVHNSDALLAKWLYKYYYRYFWRTVNKGGGVSYLETDVQFRIDNTHTYVYVLRSASYGERLNIVTNVLGDKQEIDKFISHIKWGDYGYSLSLGQDCVTLENAEIEHQVSTSRSPTFIIRDITWNPDVSAKVEQVVCKTIDGYKFKQLHQYWYINSNSEYDRYFEGSVSRPDVMSSIEDYNDNGDKLSTTLFLKDGSKELHSQPEYDKTIQASQIGENSDHDSSPYDTDDN